MAKSYPAESTAVGNRGCERSNTDIPVCPPEPPNRQECLYHSSNDRFTDTRPAPESRHRDRESTRASCLPRGETDMSVCPPEPPNRQECLCHSSNDRFTDTRPAPESRRRDRESTRASCLPRGETDIPVCPPEPPNRQECLCHSSNDRFTDTRPAPESRRRDRESTPVSCLPRGETDIPVCPPEPPNRQECLYHSSNDRFTDTRPAPESRRRDRESTPVSCHPSRV